MALGFNERTWLEWLVKVRIIVITCLTVIELAIITLTKTSVNRSLFVAVMVAWYGASIVHAVLVRKWRNLTRQSRLQTLTDLLFATAVIYVTGGIDTSFNFLYPLIIIVASVLVSEAWAFLTAALSFIFFGALIELSYFGFIDSFNTSRPDLKSLQTVILINLFGYGAIAYLSTRLTTRLRQVNVELKDKSGALQDLQALHENIVNSISGGLITTDLEGRIEVVNPAVPNLLERSESALLGRNIAELFTDKLPDPATATSGAEVRAVTPFGKEKTFGLTVSELRVPDRGIIGLIYTFDDLTQIRRLEREIQMRERLAAVGRLAAGIAHEIRNPLSSIAGSVKLLTGITALNDDERSLVDIVTRESDRLNAIITDFLIYSREMNFHMRPVDLVQLLDDTLKLLEHHPELKAAGSVGNPINIVRDFAVTSAPARGDGHKLKQVFWNISENAIRAMQQPRASYEVPPTLSVGIREEDGEWVVTFEDTGAGMTPQQVDKIFEPFQGAFQGGTGLGLAIVYQIVQAHEAKVYVRSEPGRGTKFTVRMKVGDAVRASEASAGDGAV